MTLKEKYKNVQPIGGYAISNFGGLAILELCGDYIVTAWSFGNGYENIHRSTVHYTTTLS